MYFPIDLTERVTEGTFVDEFVDDACVIPSVPPSLLSLSVELVEEACEVGLDFPPGSLSLSLW